MVKLKIDNQEELLEVYWKLQKAGLLGNVTVKDVTLPEEAFPIEVPLDLNPLLDLMRNPIVKPFKKRIDVTLTKHVLDVTTGMAQ